MKRTLGLGTGRLSKRKPRVDGLRFARRRSRAKKRKTGIWYMIFPDGSRMSTRHRLAPQAQVAASLWSSAKNHPACYTQIEHTQLDLL